MKSFFLLSSQNTEKNCTVEFRKSLKTPQDVFSKCIVFDFDFGNDA